MKRLCMLLLMILTVLLCLGSSLESAEPFGVHYENHTASPGILTIYANASDSTALAEGELEVSLSGQSLSSSGIRSAAEESVSYIFAVDASGSMKSERMELMKETLRELVSQIEADDNAAFITIGNDASRTEFYDDTADMTAFIDSLTTLQEDTNLYKGLVIAAQILAADDAVHSRSCIVVFSDGEDDIVEGYTREETEKALSETRVFSVAVQSRTPSQSVIDSSKILAGFARLSEGGVHQTLKPDGEAPVAIANRISERMGQSILMDCDLHEIYLPQDQGLLEIRLSFNGQTTTDSVMLNAAEIRAYISEPSPEPSVLPPSSEATLEATPETPPSHEVSPVPEQKNTLWLFWGLGLLLLIIIAVIVLFATKWKKKESPKIPLPDVIHTPKIQAISRFRFTFSRIGLLENEQFSVEINDELIIGRSAGHLTIPSDTRLSTRHCRIFRENERFYIEDLRSTNGTHLNGIPISSRQLLEQDSILLIGSAELRVKWETL